MFAMRTDKGLHGNVCTFAELNDSITGYSMLQVDYVVQNQIHPTGMS